MSAHMLLAGPLAAALVGLCLPAGRGADDPPAKLLSDAIAHTDTIRAVAFSPDGRLLAVGVARRPGWFETRNNPPGELIIWDVKTRKKAVTLEGHTKPINAVAFSPDGKTLASASLDKTVRLWDVATGKELAVLRDAPIGVRRLTFNPDGKTLAAVTASSSKPDYGWTWDTPNHVLLWDVATRKVRVKVDAEPSAFWSLAYSPDGRSLAVGCGKYDEKKLEWTDGEVRLLNPETGAPVTRLGVPRSRVFAVAFSPDGRFLATGSDSVNEKDKELRYWTVWGVGDGVVKLWDLSTSKVRAESKVDITSVEALAFSADSKTLAYSTGRIYEKKEKLGGMITELYIYGKVIVLDGVTLKKLATLEDHVDDCVEALAFSPVGRLLATGDGNVLNLWEIAERR